MFVTLETTCQDSIGNPSFHAVPPLMARLSESTIDTSTRFGDLRHGAEEEIRHWDGVVLGGSIDSDVQLLTQTLHQMEFACNARAMYSFPIGHWTLVWRLMIWEDCCHDRRYFLNNVSRMGRALGKSVHQE